MADNVIETGRSRIEDILLSASNGEPLSRIEEILLSLYQDLVHLDDQGLIPASLLPPQVFEHCEVVVDDTARFALTTDDVQNGDLVYVNSSQTMYFVLDDTKLDREAGYLPLAAGVAAKAIADELGNDIVQTYATKQELGDKQDATLASWTPGSATTHSTPAVGDTITEALQKIDNNQRNDEGNISTYCISKNLLNPSYNTNSGTGWSVTRNFDNTYHVVATGTNSQQFITIGSYTPSVSGTYLWTVGAVGTQSTAGMYIKVGDLYYWGGADEGDGQSISLTAGTTYVITLKISANQTLDLTFKPMIRQTGDNSYAPYAKSNAELTAAIDKKQDKVLGSWTAGTATTHQTPAGTDTVLQALQKIDNNQRNDESNISSLDRRTGFGTAVPNNTNIDNMTTIGTYYISTYTNAGTMTNLPIVRSGRLIVSALNTSSNGRLVQIYYPTWNDVEIIGKYYMRQLPTNDGWSNWYEYGGTEIVPTPSP